MTPLMQRREFITLLGGAAATWPVEVRAQQAIPVVGFLVSGSAEGYADFVAAVRQGLNSAGYIEGRNVAIEYRWADEQYDRLPAMAADLVRRRVAVIFAAGSVLPAQAAKAATTTIPIIFANGSDPIKLGLVASLNRPGGNATGVTFFGTELGPKKLELLREMVPKAAVIALLVNPDNPNTEPSIVEMQAAARILGVEIAIVGVKSENDFNTAFTNIMQQGADALVIGIDTLFNSSRHREQLSALAIRYSVPTIGPAREFVDAGGLISYGINALDMYRQAGVYTGRILKGEKPADLPVMQPTKFELVVNRKTARALGLDVPTSILLRADEVIE
jgi:putative tryptophan/tyrosine transport system substrate-binding protein